MIQAISPSKTFVSASLLLCALSSSSVVTPSHAAGLRAVSVGQRQHSSVGHDENKDEAEAAVDILRESIDDVTFLDPFEPATASVEGEESESEASRRFLWGHHMGHQPGGEGAYEVSLPIRTGGPEDLDVERDDNEDESSSNGRFDRINRGRRYHRIGDKNKNKNMEAISVDMGPLDASASSSSTTISPQLEKRIVSGSRVSSEWPTVGITLIESNGQYFPGDCGCTLISSRFALTAAHCASNMRKNDLLGRLDAVMLGAYSLYEKGSNGKNNGGRTFQVLKVKDVHEHHLHLAGGGQGNDVLLLELERDAHPYIQSRIMPVADCSYYEALPRAARLTAMGMGKTSDGGARSTVMRTVDVDFVDRNACDNVFRNYRIDETMMCAGGDGTGDACGGDSGSCLIRKTGTNGNFGTGVQVGVVSWGIGCNTQTPGVYANVCRYVDWFRSFGMVGLKVASAPKGSGNTYSGGNTNNSGGGNGNNNGSKANVGVSFSMKPMGATSYSGASTGASATVTTTTTTPKPTKQAADKKPQQSCRDVDFKVRYPDPNKEGRTKSSTCEDAAKRGACDSVLIFPSMGKGGKVANGCPVSCKVKGC